MANKKLLGLIILTVVVILALVGYGDFREIGSRLAGFPPVYLVAALFLAAINYFLRFLRWQYYLRILNISVPLGVSSLIFLSGLAMSVTPGKVGEFLKCYVLRDHAGVPVSTSAPVPLMERVTDVVAVVLLGLTGLAVLPWSVSAILAITLLGCIVIVLLVGSRYGDHLLRFPLIRRWKAKLSDSRSGMRRLTLPVPLIVAVGLGFLAWMSEGVALWVILRGLDADISLFWALPIHAASTLVGALTTLPGGLVGTESTMVALLQQSGLARSAASAGTLLVRLVTLWFAVAIGLAALACLNRRNEVGRTIVN